MAFILLNVLSLALHADLRAFGPGVSPELGVVSSNRSLNGRDSLLENLPIRVLLSRTASGGENENTERFPVHVGGMMRALKARFISGMPAHKEYPEIVNLYDIDPGPRCPE